MQGTITMGSVKKWLSELMKGDKKVKIIVAIGVIGIALILLSELFVPKSEKAKEPAQAATSISSDITQLEARIHTLISSIDGVGKAQVMITLEHSAEYVYAKDAKNDTDITKDSTDSEGARITQKGKTEESYVFVDGSSGKQALLTSERAPKVKGVVVVCEGGDDKLVQSRVIDAVTTAFDIGANRVCVTKMAYTQ